LVVTMLRTVVNPKPGILGSEEWFEEALAGFGVHAVTVVAHCNQHAGKSRQAGCCCCASDGLEAAVAGFDGNPSAVGQGVAGIEDQVE
jgi:hypothetical protein